MIMSFCVNITLCATYVHIIFMLIQQTFSFSDRPTCTLDDALETEHFEPRAQRKCQSNANGEVLQPPSKSSLWQ